MSLWTWLKEKVGTSGIIPLSVDCDDIKGYLESIGDIQILEMAFWQAVNLISNAVSKCEFRTYVDGKEEKGKEYYLWNVEPNQNQNSSEFIRELLAKLYKRNEVLVIEQGGYLYIADSFNKTEFALYEDAFHNVSFKGITFNRTFLQSEVLYFHLAQKDMRRLMAGLYASYSKLIAYSMRAFQRSRGTKGLFKYATLPAVGTEQRALFDDLVNARIRKWLESDIAALPLGNGQEFQEIKDRPYSNESTRDIRALINDISDFMAKALGIPAVLLRGDVQDTAKAVEDLLTFCIDPLLDFLQEEINRKRVGREAYLKGTYLQIDSKTVKHIDLLSVSGSIDKLIASGAFSVNDIRKLVSEPEIDEEWADKHWITKNYGGMQAELSALGGGEEA